MEFTRNYTQKISQVNLTGIDAVLKFHHWQSIIEKSIIEQAFTAFLRYTPVNLFVKSLCTEYVSSVAMGKRL
jgi:hypothetical protein